MKNKIKILSSTYTIKYVKDNTCLSRSTRCAECDYVDKEILIAKSYEGRVYSEKWLEETLHHELAHAFLYETGNDDVGDERHAELLAKFTDFILSIRED